MAFLHGLSRGPGAAYGLREARRNATVALARERYAPLMGAPLDQLVERTGTITTPMGLQLSAAWFHHFHEGRGTPGMISDLGGFHAPRALAVNAIAALTVRLNGAESGTVADYKRVKERMDGIGATATAAGLRRMGRKLLEYDDGYIVTVSTEGTAGHPKPGESPIGNPTIDIGTIFPTPQLVIARGLRVERGTTGLPFVRGLRPVFAAMDVVEGTELAATSVEAYLRMSARSRKDNGAVSVLSLADHWPTTRDTYADKIIVRKEIAEALARAGVELSLDDSYTVTLQKIAAATGRQVSQLGVISLGLKSRQKFGADGSPKGEPKNERERNRPLFEELRAAGVENFATIDDGESTVVLALANQTKVTFDNGARGIPDIMLISGGVVETMTAARAVADVGGYAVWSYADKGAAKEDIRRRREIPDAEMEAFRAVGIMDPARSRHIREDVPDGGDRILAISGITDGPIVPYVTAPVLNRGEGWFTVTGNYITGSGESVGFVFRFRAIQGIRHVREVLSPVVPNLMAVDSGSIQGALGVILADPRKAEALRAGIGSYLYTFVHPNMEPGPEFVIDGAALTEHLGVAARHPDVEKARTVLAFLTTHRPDWFANPDALAGLG